MLVEGLFSEEPSGGTKIFRSELSLALEAIRYGDRVLFDSNPELDLIPVIVNFKSTDKRYNKTENWCSLGDYKI
jgi:hypothetical protein